MSTELQFLGKMIEEKKLEIATLIHRKRLDGVQLTQMQQEELSKMEDHIISIRSDFIGIFGEALINWENPSWANERISKWGKETGEYFYNLGARLDEALKDTSFYREYIWKYIKEEVIKQNIPISVIFEVIQIIDPLLDQAAYSYSLNYVHNFQKTLENAKSSFLELSVPVVPLMREVGVLPLVGNIDTERASLLMEKTLQQSANLKLNYLIIDISGVMIVDTMVANQIFKVLEALSLLGVKTIITGIRPEVAQTMVTLGIKTDGIMVMKNLHQALNKINSLLSNKYKKYPSHSRGE